MMNNKHAQSLVEYLAIVTLITVGMIAGKQFFTGGFKGGIENLTGTVDDAFHDRLGQAPPDGSRPPSCNCGPVVKVCGGSTPNLSLQCPGNEMLEYQICNPSGCNNVSPRCFPDDSCCTLPQLEAGTCGPNAPAPPGVPGWGCDDGYGIGRWRCGNQPIRRACQRFAGSPPGGCNFVCQNIQSFSTPCPDTTTRLYSNMNYALMNRCSDVRNPPPPPPPDKCKSVCQPGYRRNGNICEACPVALNKTDVYCGCSGRRLDTVQPITCDSGEPFSTMVCSRRPAVACYARGWTPNIIDVVCPAGTVPDSGYCGYRDNGNWMCDRGWSSGNNVGITGSDLIPGVPGWRCQIVQCLRSGCSGACTTCNSVGLEAAAFCVPPPGCAQPVLEDIVIRTRPSSGTAPLCPNGYRQVARGPRGSSNPEVRFCARIGNYAPHETCARWTVVLGDIFINGDCLINPGNPNSCISGSRWVTSYDRANPTRPPNISLCPNAPLGAGPTAPYWNDWAWNGRSGYRYIYCQKKIPAAAQLHCLAEASCPPAKRKRVIVDLLPTWCDPGQAACRNNPILCSSLGSGWVEAGYEGQNFSNIRWCKQEIDICVQ